MVKLVCSFSKWICPFFRIIVKSHYVELCVLNCSFLDKDGFIASKVCWRSVYVQLALFFVA